MNETEIEKRIKYYEYLTKNGFGTELIYVTLIGKPIIERHSNSITKIGKGLTLVSDSTFNVANIKIILFFYQLLQKEQYYKFMKIADYRLQV